TSDSSDSRTSRIGSKNGECRRFPEPASKSKYAQDQQSDGGNQETDIDKCRQSGLLRSNVHKSIRRACRGLARSPGNLGRPLSATNISPRMLDFDRELDAFFTHVAIVSASFR